MPVTAKRELYVKFLLARLLASDRPALQRTGE
jgi:hypothetical protein